MIPHRMLNRENSGAAVRYRVDACRKRLRTVRAHRTQLSDSMADEFQEAEISSAEVVQTCINETAAEFSMLEFANIRANVGGKAGAIGGRNDRDEADIT